MNTPVDQGDQLTQSRDYVAARREVAALRRFYVHLMIYALVISLLFVINLWTFRVWWVQWPMLGWGIGLLLHRLLGVRDTRFLGPDWERRKIDEILARRRGPGG